MASLDKMLDPGGEFEANVANYQPTNPLEELFDFKGVHYYQFLVRDT